MINEKPNNIDWKNKLEDLESGTGDVFNKDASWNSLHKRLQAKQKDGKVVWYWLAAACLLFALFISFFFSNKKENVLVKNNVLPRKIDSSYLQRVPLINNDTSAFASSLSIENKRPVHFVNSNGKINTIINHKAILQTEIAQNKKEEIIPQEIKNSAVMPVDTAISIVANLPEKKKLKVVHINELGEPAEVSPDVARNSIIHSFQFRLAGEEVYINHPEKSDRSGFIVLKSKNSPN